MDHIRLSFTVIALVLCLYWSVRVFLEVSLREEDDSEKNSADQHSHRQDATNRIIKNAVVVANGIECAQIGIDILKKNGTVADAAIATLFCEGVASPQSMGLGGGFMLTIYKKDSGKVQTLVARETAPAAAYKDMFHGKKINMSKGSLAVAVPGELRGYEELYKAYGSLPWKQLIEPTIKLCRKGHILSKYCFTRLHNFLSDIQKEKFLREIFVNPKTGQLKKKGDRIKRPTLAKTLQTIAEEGADALYNGTLTKTFIDDIRSVNGIITEEDMWNYKAKWEEPVTATLPDNMKMYTSPLPGSGIILAYIMNILNGFVPDLAVDPITEYQRIVESFKFAFAHRTRLGDREFVDNIEPLIANLTSMSYAQATRKFILDDRTNGSPSYYGAYTAMPDSHGTAHISILAPNGDAISVTSSINEILGAKVCSKSTGIILNNQMAEFNAPNMSSYRPSPSNFIVPGKRPMSSMCPTIILNKEGNVRLIIGGDGGLRIPTGVAFVAIRHLWYKDNLAKAIKAKRIHHQLFPMKLYNNHGLNKRIRIGLAKKGHRTVLYSRYGNVMAIAQEDGKIIAATDPKRRGSIAAF